MCCRKRLIQCLPNLKQLDLREIGRGERMEAGCQVSSDESEDEDQEEEEDGAVEQESSNPLPSLKTIRPKLPDIEGKS
jgi:hypothetical protein